MLDPLTITTTVFSIVKVINKANNLLTAMRGSPGEFRAFSSHVKSLALVLESVRTDLVDNKQSIINKSRELHTEKKLDLNHLIQSCDRGLKKIGRLLQNYRGELREGLWGAWGWTQKGSAEVQGAMNDLQSLTGLVNLFIQKEVAQGVGRLEQVAREGKKSNMRQTRQMSALLQALGIPEPRDPSKDAHQLFTTGIFISRWIGRLRARKAPTRLGGVNKPIPKPNPSLKNSLRSSGYITRTVVPQTTATSSGLKLKGWRVASHSLGFTPTLHQGVPLKRTQTQLQELVKVAQTGHKSLGRKHHAVKWLMGRVGTKWTFVGGQIEGGERFVIVLKRD